MVNEKQNYTLKTDTKESYLSQSWYWMKEGVKKTNKKPSFKNLTQILALVSAFIYETSVVKDLNPTM